MARRLWSQLYVGSGVSKEFNYSDSISSQFTVNLGQSNLYLSNAQPIAQSDVAI